MLFRTLDDQSETFLPPISMDGELANRRDSVLEAACAVTGATVIITASRATAAGTRNLRNLDIFSNSISVGSLTLAPSFHFFKILRDFTGR